MNKKRKKEKTVFWGREFSRIAGELSVEDGLSTNNEVMKYIERENSRCI